MSHDLAPGYDLFDGSLDDGPSFEGQLLVLLLPSFEQANRPAILSSALDELDPTAELDVA